MVSRQTYRRLRFAFLTATVLTCLGFLYKWSNSDKETKLASSVLFEDSDDMMMMALKSRKEASEKNQQFKKAATNLAFEKQRNDHEFEAEERPKSTMDDDADEAHAILEAAQEQIRQRRQAKLEEEKKFDPFNKIHDALRSNEGILDKVHLQIDDLLKRLIANEELINELENILKARLNIINDKQTEILKQTNAITRKHDIPFFKITKFSSPPVSTINCFGNSTTDRVCKVKNLCYDPPTDKFFIFKDVSSLELNTPKNRSYLVDMTSIDGHNRFFFDYQEVHPDRYEQRSFRAVEKLTFLIARFHSYNIMHTVHDDFIGLYLLHRMFAPNLDPDPTFSFTTDSNIFFTDSFKNLRYDYIFQLLTSNPLQFREFYRTEPESTLPICFRDAVIGNSKLGSWYTYGFLEPQGPIANKTVSGLLIREVAGYIIRRFHMPLWNENSIRGIVRELKEITEKRKSSKRREPLFHSISDHHFITIFSRKLDRLILNENDLADRLERLYGMEVRYVRIEDMHLMEQISILKNTVIAMGMHGSALILSMFLPPGALLVEFFPYRVPAENYTPYKTLCSLPGMRLAYRAWTNTHAQNNYAHPERPSAGGGLVHLPEEKQLEIKESLTVPPHLCCADPTWLYRIYQDTRIELDEVFDLIDDGIMDAYNLINSDPAEFVYIRPASVEHVYCRVTKSEKAEGDLDLHISWTQPWNGVKPDFYGVWMHQPFKEFNVNSTDFVFRSCKPDMDYDLWVRPYTYDKMTKDTFKGSYSDKFTCKCNLNSFAVKGKVESEEV